MAQEYAVIKAIKISIGYVLKLDMREKIRKNCGYGPPYFRPGYTYW
jgi:hypothetical protein